MEANVRRSLLACELGRPTDGARGCSDFIWTLEYERGTE